MCQHGSILVKALVQFIAGPFLLCPHMVEWARELCGISFLRALILLMRAPSHELITSQRPHLLKPSQWALEFQHMSFEGTQTFRP